MQREDKSYRRAENFETAVNKGHHNIGNDNSPLRCCGFFANALPLLSYMSFLNFVLVSSDCSYSLNARSITMTMERLGKYFMRKFQIPLC